MNQDDRTMLALAALTYRGFGRQGEAAIAEALRPWLPRLDAEGLGKWDLVWGPAAFRAPTSLFDDAMMYVARQRDRPAGERPRYVVAIRGTNPVSAFDWVFGDLWVRLQVDWEPAGAAPAKLSASTALGLAIAQHLAAEVPPSSGGVLAPLGNALASALREFAKALPEIEPDRLLREPGSFSDVDLETRIDALTGAAGNALRARALDRLRDRFDDSRRSLLRRFRKLLLRRRDRVDVVHRHVFDRLVHHIETARGPGESLIQFLNRDVDQPASVAVTGHSKGGALAIATSLWLAETWAPARQAEIECFSFAGPTAGDAAFARRYDAALAGRTRRIVNRRDVVPHAWVPEELRGLARTYPVLGPALKVLADSVAQLGYTHVGGEVVDIASQAAGGNLVQEIIHQHLDAYLAAAGLHGPQWSAQSIFLGD